MNQIGLRSMFEKSAQSVFCSPVVANAKKSGLHFLILFLAVDLICSPIAHKNVRLIVDTENAQKALAHRLIVEKKWATWATNRSNYTQILGKVCSQLAGYVDYRLS